MTIKEDIQQLKLAEREEISKVQKMYKDEVDEIRKHCKHKFSEWFITPNEYFRYDINGLPIYIRKCRLCDWQQQRHGEES